MKQLRAIWGVILALVLFGMAGGIALASDISDALYSGIIRISNNSTLATCVSVNCSISTQELIDAGYINSSCNNTAIRTNTGTDAAFMPAVTTGTSWLIFVLNINNNSHIDYNLYCGGPTNMNGKLAYFPGSSGMVTTDNDTYLEPADNFSIVQKVWVNTTPGSNKYLVSKPGTLLVYITGTENITASLTNTQTIDVGSAATDRGATRSPGYTHIDLTNSANATGIISSVSTWANTEMTGVRVGTFYLDSGTIYKCRDSETIGTVAAGSALTYSGLSIDVVAGDFIGYYCDGGDIETDSAGGSGIRWIIGEYIDPGDSADYALYANQRISLYGAGYLSITASGVASGNHTITTALSGGTFSLTVDSSAPVTIAYEGSTANTTDNWTFYTNNVTAYMEYQKIYIGGVLRQHIIWQNATIFTDQSGNGQDAVPSFRTDSSNAYVSANLTSFLPIAESDYAGGTAETTADNITGPPSAIASMYTELSITAPGAAFINALLDGGGIPRALFWFPFLFTFSIGASFLSYWGSKSIMVKAIVSWFLLAVFAFMGGFGFWVLFPYTIESLAVVLAAKRMGW